MADAPKTHLLYLMTRPLSRSRSTGAGGPASYEKK